MKSYSLLVGSRQKGSRKGLSRRDEKLIHEITFRHFSSGFTVLDAEGGWYDGERDVFVREKSKQILISSATLAPVRRWSHEIGAALNQRELLVVELGTVHSFKIRQNKK